MSIPNRKMLLGITDHLEGPRGQPSAEIFDQVMEQTELADRVGFEYAWFAEHHAHAHAGHLPAPLLLALHLAGRTRNIRLGTAIICLNLHHPLSVAEQCATADILMNGRSAFGFGSGSTPEEVEFFGLSEGDEADRHQRFASALRMMLAAWGGSDETPASRSAKVGPLADSPHAVLPVARADLRQRSWLAVNSAGSAAIAGELGFNMLFSHLRTPAQYCEYAAVYRAAGGAGLLAANRPVIVAKDDATAWGRAEPAVRMLWRRFQREGRIPADASEPAQLEDLCGHPINFIVGSPATVARQLAELHARAPFDVANVEVRWPGLSAEAIHESIRLMAGEVREKMRTGITTRLP